MEKRYYTYAYLNDDGTIYYVGKGTGNRAYTKTKNDKVKCPENKDRIILLKNNLTEDEAFAHEKYMIDVLGRVKLGGILTNKMPGNTPRKNSEKKSRIEEIIDNKKIELIDALRLAEKKIDLEKLLDNLIQDIVDEYTMSPFELFCYHYKVDPIEKYKEIFEESYLGTTFNVKIEVNGKQVSTFKDTKNISIFYDLEDTIIENGFIWTDEGHYFKEVRVSKHYIGEEEYLKYEEDEYQKFLKQMEEIEEMDLDCVKSDRSVLDEFASMLNFEK